MKWERDRPELSQPFIYNCRSQCMRFFLLLLPALLVLTACATRQQMAWYHSSGHAGQQQFNTDNAICTGVAHRSAGAPPAQQSSTSTTFSGQTSSGTTFQGQATTSPSNQMWGMAAGFQAAEVQARHEQAIRSIHRGCMAERGWTLQPRQ